MADTKRPPLVGSQLADVFLPGVGYLHFWEVGFVWACGAVAIIKI